MASLACSAVEPITSKNGFREKSITYNLYVSTRLIKKSLSVWRVASHQVIPIYNHWYILNVINVLLPWNEPYPITSKNCYIYPDCPIVKRDTLRTDIRKVYQESSYRKKNNPTNSFYFIWYWNLKKYNWLYDSNFDFSHKMSMNDRFIEIKK